MEHINFTKLTEPQTLKFEWRAEQVCVVRGECGAALVADVKLTSGVWYFECKVGKSGEVCVGVLPKSSHDTFAIAYSAAFAAEKLCPFTFNGLTGTVHMGRCGAQ